MITIKCDCCGRKIRRNGAPESYWRLNLQAERYEGSDNKDEEGLALADDSRELDICNECLRNAEANVKNRKMTRPDKIRRILDGAMGLGMFELQAVIENETEEE